MPDRPLFTVGSANCGFRVVACSARQALVHIRELRERGLEDMIVTGPDGRRREVAELEALVATASGEQSD